MKNEIEFVRKNELRKVVDEIITDYSYMGLRNNSRTSGNLTFKLDGRQITVTTTKDDYKSWRRYAVFFLGRDNPKNYSEMYFLDTNWAQKSKSSLMLEL